MKFLNALNKIEGVGSQKFFLLMEYFKDAEKIWKASMQEIISAGISENLAKKIISEREKINPDKEWAELEKEGIEIISVESDHYPPLLKEIPGPPYLIYIKGNKELLLEKMISIVGSRKFTEYGKRVAGGFGRDLANAGLVVVSGLALGIDAIAHQGALEAKGKTIAVLGNSLDKKSIHPRTNFELAEEIISGGGLLLSEYPIPTSPSIGTFPARNRIMAGISLGTVVVEAALDSGSLITANHAVEFNREVFAVPGPIFYPQSQGPHMLIKKGAKITSSINDILEEIGFIEGFSIKSESSYQPESDEEASVLKNLSQEPIHIDTILKLSKLETSTANSTLTMLEIKGVVKNIGGGNYIKNI